MAAGFDPSTLKLLYSVSDQEQDQFFATKGTATEKIEQGGMVFYRAIFSEKFSFTMSGDATDALNIKVFTTISSGSDSSERMLECLRYRVKDNLVKFFD